MKRRKVFLNCRQTSPQHGVYVLEYFNNGNLTTKEEAHSPQFVCRNTHSTLASGAQNWAFYWLFSTMLLIMRDIFDLLKVYYTLFWRSWRKSSIMRWCAFNCTIVLLFLQQSNCDFCNQWFLSCFIMLLWWNCECCKSTFMYCFFKSCLCL